MEKKELYHFIHMWDTKKKATDEQTNKQNPHRHGQQYSDYQRGRGVKGGGGG